jgi:hypothetical protein
MEQLRVPAPGWKDVTDAFAASALSLNLHDAVKDLYES